MRNSWKNKRKEISKLTLKMKQLVVKKLWEKILIRRNKNSKNWRRSLSKQGKARKTKTTLSMMMKATLTTNIPLATLLSTTQLLMMLMKFSTLNKLLKLLARSIKVTSKIWWAAWILKRMQSSTKICKLLNNSRIEKKLLGNNATNLTKNNNELIFIE